MDQASRERIKLGCYREVAMRWTLGRDCAPAFLIGAVLLLAGCSEVYTTARRSNEEGMRLYSERMYTEAAGAFRDAVKQDPRDYNSQFYLGVCYDEFKQHQAAFKQYRIALDLMEALPWGKRDDEFRQLVLDTYASAVARYDDREGELNEIEKRAGENPTANNWFLLAKCYRLRGDADNALIAYRKAALTDNWDFFIRKEAGLYLLDPLGQRQEATYYLLQAHRLNPNDLAVNTGLTRLGVNPQPAYEAADPNLHPPVQPRIQPVQHVGKPARSAGATATLPRD